MRDRGLEHASVEALSNAPVRLLGVTVSVVALLVTGCSLTHAPSAQTSDTSTAGEPLATIDGSTDGTVDSENVPGELPDLTPSEAQAPAGDGDERAHG